MAKKMAFSVKDKQLRLLEVLVSLVYDDGKYIQKNMYNLVTAFIYLMTGLQ